MKNFIITFIILLFVSVEFYAQYLSPGETAVLTGKILSAEDTGLGPLDGVTIENSSNGESVYFMMDRGLYNGISSTDIIGKKVEVLYRTNHNKLITDLMLVSEFESAAAQAHVYLEGKYISGEVGDMGSYVTIRHSDGREETYLGGFEIGADNVEKYSGKNVILYYEENFENEILELRLLK